jgi:hypothetical protein
MSNIDDIMALAERFAAHTTHASTQGNKYGDVDGANTAWRTLRAAIEVLTHQMPGDPVVWRWKTHNGYAYSDEHYADEGGEPLYIAPQRQPHKWVGLTRAERMEMINSLVGADLVYLLDAVEQRLREKNIAN